MVILCSKVVLSEPATKEKMISREETLQFSRAISEFYGNSWTMIIVEGSKRTGPLLPSNWLQFRD